MWTYRGLEVGIRNLRRFLLLLPLRQMFASDGLQNRAPPGAFSPPSRGVATAQLEGLAGREAYTHGMCRKRNTPV